MNTRRELLGHVTSAVAGIAFVECGLLAARSSVDHIFATAGPS